MIEFVEPEVLLLAETFPNTSNINRAIEKLGFDPNYFSIPATGDIVSEFAGRLCYKSFDVGVNPNVTKIRSDSREYWDNLISSGHGSVFEHVNYTFLFHNVSRVFTHELVRHRVGTAISQESGRYVRVDPDNIKITWLPDWYMPTAEQAEMMDLGMHHLYRAYHEYLNWEAMTFKEKKEWTSFIRRFLPNGIATNIVWTANVRTIRHVLTMRSSPEAEEEFVFVCGKIADLISNMGNPMFQDMRVETNGKITFNNQV